MNIGIIVFSGVVVGVYLVWTYAAARAAGKSVPHLSDSEELDVRYD